MALGVRRDRVAPLLVVAITIGGCAGERVTPSAVPGSAPEPTTVPMGDAAPAGSVREASAPHADAAAIVDAPSGDPARVRQLFMVEAADATDAVTGARVPVLLGEGVLSMPTDGLYVLLDTAGRIGDARVQASRTRGWDRSASTPPLHVELQWVSPPSRDARRSLHVVAVGPLDATLPRARLMSVGIARAGLSPATPDDSDHVHGPHGSPFLAVDLDGDGEADLARYDDRHARRAAAPHTMSWDVRGETWLRAPPSSPWQEVESCAWIDSTLVGP